MIYHATCQSILADWPDSTIDAVVTDPPYGLGFMGIESDSETFAIANSRLS